MHARRINMAAIAYDTGKQQLYINLIRVFGDLTEKLKLPEKLIDEYKQIIQSTVTAEPNQIQKFSTESLKKVAVVCNKPKKNVKRKSTVMQESAAKTKKCKLSQQAQFRKSNDADAEMLKKKSFDDEHDYGSQFSSSYLKNREEEMLQAVKELAESLKE